MPSNRGINKMLLLSLIIILGLIFFNMLFNDKRLPFDKPVYGSYDVYIVGLVLAALIYLFIIIHK